MDDGPWYREGMGWELGIRIMKVMVLGGMGSGRGSHHPLRVEHEAHEGQETEQCVFRIRSVSAILLH